MSPAAADPTDMTAATDDTTPEAGGTAPDDGSDQDQDQGDDEGTVLLTVMAKPGGAYALIAGDEDDDEGEGDEGAGEGAEASEAGPGGDGTGTTAVEGEEPTKPEEQTFASKGALMAAILKLLNAHEAEAGGEEQGFDEGYTGSQAATPKS